MPFLPAPAGAWRMLGGWRRSGWLWCCGGHVGDVLMTYGPNEVVQRVQFGGGRGSERRVQSRSTPETKPGSLWTYGPAPIPVATPKVFHQPSDCSQGITTLFSTSRYPLVFTFKLTSKMWGGMMWPSFETTPKTITVAGNFFSSPWAHPCYS